MSILEVTTIKIEDLEDHNNIMKWKDGEYVNSTGIEKLVRDILREEVWCILTVDTLFEVHFGYDYYMYFVGQSLTYEVMNNLASITDLYIEKKQSPYIDRS